MLCSETSSSTTFLAVFMVDAGVYGVQVARIWDSRTSSFFHLLSGLLVL
jgi:hypothetical protein